VQQHLLLPTARRRPASVKKLPLPHPSTPGRLDPPPEAPDPVPGTTDPAASATAAAMVGITMAVVVAGAQA